MTAPTCYFYSYVDFTYTGEGEGTPDPANPGQYLLPGFATWLAPPSAGSHQIAVYSAAEGETPENWTLVADYRNTQWRDASNAIHYITSIGVEPDPSWTLLEIYTLSGVSGELNYLSWTDDTHNFLHAVFKSSITVTVQVQEGSPDWLEVQRAVNNGFYILDPRLADWFVVNETGDGWVMDDTLQVQGVLRVTGEERDAYLATSVAINVNGTDLYVVNDTQTQAAFTAYNLAVPTLNDDSFVVPFKGEDAEGNVLWADMDGAALQNAALTLTLRMRKAFAVQQTVTTANLTERYQTEADVRAAYALAMEA